MQARLMMYKSVIQTMLIYRSDSWVIMDAMLKVLEGFHHQVDCHIAGISYWQVW